MTKCVICDKEIKFAKGDVCSSKCAMSATKVSSSSSTSVSVKVNEIQEKASELGIMQGNKVDMIKVKHRWMKHRNKVFDGVVFSFDGEGFAVIENLGNNILAAEGLCRASKGLIKIVHEEPPKVKKPVVAPVKPVKKKVEQKAAETKKKEEKLVEFDIIVGEEPKNVKKAKKVKEEKIVVKGEVKKPFVVKPKKNKKLIK